MKTLLLVFGVALLFACNSDKKADSETAELIVNFEKSTYAEALVKAQKMNRLLLVDFYSDT